MLPHSLTITRPDDWHIHLRDEAALGLTVPAVSRVFGRAIVMPNMVPPITSVQAASAYKQRILAARPKGSSFEPLMTLYLTDTIDIAEIEKGARESSVFACKLYPAGATTNSDSGVTDIAHIYPVLEAMQRTGMPLLVHGEVTHTEVDIFDREKRFIDGKLLPLIKDFPDLKVVFEHITTAEAASLVSESTGKLAATITAHHLLYDRNHMLVGGIRPHYYCLPILKRRSHQEALLAAATSECPYFFLGSDSAPHAVGAKESDCGCAGCYTGHATLELYAQAFENANALHRLEAFASFNGPDFYGVSRNPDQVRLERKPWIIPEHYKMDDGVKVRPLNAGDTSNWQVSDMDQTESGAPSSPT